METKVEALEDNRVKVTVTVDAKEIDGRIKKTYKDFALQVQLSRVSVAARPRAQVIDNALGAEAVRATRDRRSREREPILSSWTKATCIPSPSPTFEDGGLVEAGQALCLRVHAWP